MGRLKIMGTKYKKIWFIRHGESEANAGCRTSDPAVIPLTANGRRQASEIAASFEEQPALVVSSRYLRAKQTARPLLDRFRQVPYEEWDVHEFTYLSPLRCGDTTIFDRRPLVEAFWNRADPNYCDGKGAESFADFMKRVQGVVNRMEMSSVRFCAVFSHMQFIAAVLWRMGNPCRAIDAAAMISYKSFLDINQFPNGSIVPIPRQMD